MESVREQSGMKLRQSRFGGRKSGFSDHGGVSPTGRCRDIASDTRETQPLQIHMMSVRHTRCHPLAQTHSARNWQPPSGAPSDVEETLMNMVHS